MGIFDAFDRVAETELARHGSLFINGQWHAEGTGGRFSHVNAATGAVQCELTLAGKADVDAAVDAARRAAPGWRRYPVDERRRLLLTLAKLLREQADDLAMLTTLENGTPTMVSSVLCQLPAEYFEYYAGWVDKIEGSVIPTYPGRALDYTTREPYGVIGVIIPWNAPMVSIGQKIPAALAAGNCVVVKPPELAPFTALRFAELCESAGLPAGVLNVVPGGPEAGDALVSHPGVDKISFTGGIVTARKVLAAAAPNVTPVILELGGKSANIVFADADLDSAVAMAVQTGLTTLSGQGCVLPTRLLVQGPAYDEVVSEVLALAQAVAVGDPRDPDTLMGPVVSAAHCERIEGVITEARSAGSGTLLTGGGRLDGELADGFFLPPTVFADVDATSRLAQEEIFGPVLSVLRFRTEAEAIELANATPYGLGGFVHTTDLARAHRVAAQLDAGYIGVNSMPLIPPNTPFGGYKQSGWGREGGRAGLEEFLQTKNIYVDMDLLD